MAQICYGPCEFFPPVLALLVAAPHIYYILVFFEIFFLFGQEGGVDPELRKHMVPVYFVCLYLVEDLHGHVYDLRMVREQGTHLFLALEVLLLGVAHPVRVVKVGVAVEADEPVMGRPVLLVDEMDIVRRQHLCPRLCRQFVDAFIDGLLPLIQL